MALRLAPKPPKPPRTKREQVQDRLAALVPEWILKCPRCGSMELIETRTGVRSKKGKPSGGTKSLICLHYMVKGERAIHFFETAISARAAASSDTSTTASPFPSNPMGVRLDVSG